MRGFEVGAPEDAAPAEVVNGRLELCFIPDSRVWDGRFANNAWLQETPDFMTKLVWDNAALVSPATAEALGLRNGQVVTLEQGGRSLTCAAYVMPGQARGSIGIALGYGRGAAGRVGGDASAEVAPVGFDANRLRNSAAPDAAGGLKVVATRDRYKFATTQDMFAIDAVGMAEREKRVTGQHDLVREASLEEYRADPAFAKYVSVPLLDLWERPDVAVRHAWGMTIDLGKCTGCNACVVGCQAENNIPVVGKEQVSRGRIMHWIRIDRYFAGDRDDPRVVNQPLACQQCENAPCEQVCPVAATTHNQDGLNDMVYNRCVGTRYCANNCPYKVRRFNYLDFHDDLDKHEPDLDLKKMAYNPEVTVRWRGVMEKCTYCVQRIQAGRIKAKREGNREVKDGEVVTACQQACPTEAIVFGDLKQPRSRVSELAAAPRAYQMLAELNVDPRTRYLARVRNPDPALPKAEVKHDKH
ncbi:MAG: 4Fe-4S dicluster domain-containing protein [Planctomycetota bacterium]